MKIISLCFLSLSLLVTSVQAKVIQLEIAYSQFLEAGSDPYLEVYFSLNGNSVDYIANNQGQFVGGIEVTLTLQSDSTIVGADRFRLLSPALNDTSAMREAFIHQARLAVPQGSYTMVLDITDINDAEEVYRVEQPVEVNFDLEHITSSDIILLEGYQPSQSNGVFSKSGYELLPLVNSGTPYFPEEFTELSFYTEIYNTDKKLGGDEPFVIKYYLRDLVKNKSLNEYASFSRKSTAAVTPVLASFNIENLRTGNYEIVLEVLNRNGDEVFSRKQFFYRKNSLAPDAQLIPDSLRMATFVDKLGGLDSIFLFIKYLYPISTDAQRKTQDNLLAERELDNMKSYFYGFWSRVDEENPSQAWAVYKSKVKVANDKFKTRIRPGYLSDRGRVFLMYGQPSRTDSRRFEPSLPPYEIWQFDAIRTPYVAQQNNRIFIFAEFQPSTNDYELFHSNAIGELASRRWRYDMAMKYAGMNGNIDDDMPDSEFGSRTNNNIILNGTGADRVIR